MEAAQRDGAEILERSETLAVVGLSASPWKAAHSVPAAMQAAGFRVIPVNPHADEILGEKAYRTLDDVPDRPIDVVQMFRPSEEAPAIAEAAVRIGARALWLQSGLRSESARRIATEAGLDYVEDTCMAVVRSRLGIRKHRA